MRRRELDNVMSIPNEVYQHGHHASVVTNHAKRTAETEAAFFLPFLKPGMRLLDVGCGPGSITTGLALRVAPAQKFNRQTTLRLRLAIFMSLVSLPRALTRCLRIRCYST